MFSLGGSQFTKKTDINGNAIFTSTVTGNLTVTAQVTGYSITSASSEIVDVWNKSRSKV